MATEAAESDVAVIGLVAPGPGEGGRNQRGKRDVDVRRSIAANECRGATRGLLCLQRGIRISHHLFDLREANIADLIVTQL